jgi:hypothetical protein
MTQENLNLFNTAFYFFLIFHPTNEMNTMVGFNQELNVKIEVFGVDKNGTEVLLTKPGGENHIRKLVCPQNQQSLVNSNLK